MIAVSILLDVRISLVQAGNILGQLEGFEDRAGVLFTTPQVVNLGASRVEIKLIHKRSHILRMDIVSDLFPFVAVNFVFSAFEIAFDEVAQKPV